MYMLRQNKAWSHSIALFIYFVPSFPFQFFSSLHWTFRCRLFHAAGVKRSTRRTLFETCWNWYEESALSCSASHFLYWQCKMAPPTSGSNANAIVKLEEEIEGDQIGSRDYRFCRIGEPVPIKADGISPFDPENEVPPLQPLAVSERFRLVFVAHSDGQHSTLCVSNCK